MPNLPSCAQSPGAWYCFGQGEQYGESYMGNVEHGVDIATPFHTPITALYGGRVTDASYKPWGGQVGILTDVPGYGTVVEYVQHLDQIASNVTVGSQVTSGELLGLSGGQLSGGSHPTTINYSSAPHTEFGIDAPWVAGLQPGMPQFPNTYPNAFISAAQAGTLASGAGPSGIGGTCDICGSAPTSPACKACAAANPNFAQQNLTGIFPNMEQWYADITNPSLWIGRILPITLGFAIVVVALYAMFK